MPHRLTIPFAAVLAITAYATATDPGKDAFGDPLPEGATTRLGTARALLPMGYVMAIPPRFDTVLVGKSNKGMTIQEVSSGRVVGRIAAHATAPPGNPVMASADGSRLVTWRSGTVVVWDIKTGQPVAELRIGAGLTGAPWGDNPMIALSADASVLVTGGNPDTRKQGEDGRKVEVAIWDVGTKQRKSSLVVTTDHPITPLFSADGSTLATWGVSNIRPPPRNRPPAVSKEKPDPKPSPEAPREIQLWNVATGQEVSRVRTANTWPVAVALTPDGKAVAASCGDGVIELWDVKTGKPRPPLFGRTGQGQRLAFAPDGKTLAAIAWDGTIERWVVADGRHLGATSFPLNHDRLSGLGIGMGFSDNERMVAWGRYDAIGVVWEAPTRKLLSAVGEQTSVVMTIGFPTGGQEVTTCDGDGRLIWWDMTTGKPRSSRILRPGILPGVSFLPPVLDSPMLAPDASRVVTQTVSPAVFDLTSGEEVFALRVTAPPEYQTSSRLSADRSKAVLLSCPPSTKDLPSRCQVWDLTTRRRVSEVDIEFGPGVTGTPGAALSPDGTRVVIAYSRRSQPGKPSTLHIAGWDVKTGKKLSMTEDADATGLHVQIAAASHTSAVFIFGNGRLKAVDYERGQLGFEIGRGVNPIVPPVFSPDGTRFAVAEAASAAGGADAVRVYDWPRGKLIHTFTGHRGMVTALAFSPDGKTLASGSLDTTVLLWDLTRLERK